MKKLIIMLLSAILFALPCFSVFATECSHESAITLSKAYCDECKRDVATPCAKCGKLLWEWVDRCDACGLYRREKLTGKHIAFMIGFTMFVFFVAMYVLMVINKKEDEEKRINQTPKETKTKKGRNF